ncbi:MAG: hypothetical protein JXB30_13190 [Anaerolineae bacterium]|nr:hypothetical protein [Anaerolineae bacterium]
MKLEKITPDTLRWLALGWMAIVLIGGVCTFVGALALLSNRDNAETSQQNTPMPTQPVAQALPTLEPGITPTVWMPVDDGTFALGGQTFVAPIAHPDLMHNIGMSWVKYQIKWDPSSDPGLATAHIEKAHQAGFKILLSIPGQPWPQTTIDYESYITYLTAVASSQPDAIEVWNEMNLDREWPAGEIDPVSYVNNMLIPAYNAIKAASPNTMVIIGALSPTGLDDGTNIWSDARYAQGMADAGAANYADCVGVHHNGGTTPPSATSGHAYDSGDNHYSWYYQPTIDVYHNVFPSLPVCLTEFGYLSPEGYGELPEGFGWGSGTTVDNQASWLAEGVTMARASGYVRLVIVWNVDSETWDDDPQAGFAILRPDGTCPACNALQAVMMGN